MTEKLYIGIDLGTTMIKAGLFDTSGLRQHVVSREFHFPENSKGYAEFDINVYMDSVFDAVREVLAVSGAAASMVRGISIASQAQTFVVLDKDDKPLRPAISWLDVRAKQEAADLSVLSRKELGVDTDAIATASKLCWIARNEPDIFHQIKYVLLLPDYLIYKLTGRRITSIRTAESTGLYDRSGGRWVQPLLDFCGLKEEMMSEPAWPGELAGSLKPEAAEKLGLNPQTIVAVGAMDQLAGAIAAGNVHPGFGSINLGTALAIIVTAEPGRKNPDGVSLRPHPVRGMNAMLTYTKTAGIVLRWFKENFADSLSYEQLFEQISVVPVGCEGLKCVPHFNGTATPKFDPSVRGAFSGISLRHGKFHMARSIVESLCFAINENLSKMSVGNSINRMCAIGGGAVSDVWLQMIADSAGLQIERPVVKEACCFGAAQLAMAADRAFANIAEASLGLYKKERSFYPNPDAKKLYDKLFAEYRQLYQSLGIGY